MLVKINPCFSKLGEDWAKPSMMVLCTNAIAIAFSLGSIVRDNLRNLVPFLKFPPIGALINQMSMFITLGASGGRLRCH